MKTLNRLMVSFTVVLMSVFASGCEMIGDIFEAGVWSGVLLVVGGILLLIFLVTRILGGGRNKS